MKMQTTFIVLLSSSPLLTLAFAPLSIVKTSNTALAAEPSAVQAALDASKKYGVTSPEARVLWDAVEEMRSADNSVATKAGLDVECDIDDVDQACMEYDQKMQELRSLMEQYNEKLGSLKEITQNLSQLKMGVNTATKQDSPEVSAKLQEALDAAKQTVSGTPEAALAWETVEELASSGLDNSMGTRLDEECLVEQAMEACMALEELNRALNLPGNI